MLNTRSIGWFIAIWLLLLIPGMWAAQFSDIATYKYADSIKYITDRWIVKWYPDGTYWPNREITRAELMKIIFEGVARQTDRSLYTGCFDDVNKQWYAWYICYAKQNNLVKWYPDNTFKPAQKVTVAEALKITLWWFSMWVVEWKWMQWYQPFVDFVHNNSIFSKYGLSPVRNFTRGEMAYLVHQLMLQKEGKRVFSGVRDSLSKWCGKTRPVSQPMVSIVNGEPRTYITAVWSNYDERVPTKLIFAFHGRTNPNTMVRSYYKVEQAAKWNAIVIYPLWLPEEGPVRNWMNPWDKPDQLRDYALFDQLMKEMGEAYCIDLDQIYVVGHSLWAWFTNSLACARGDVIRGIGSVWWSVTKSACTGPVAAVIMHHPEDNLASFAGWVAARDLLLQQNGCWPETTPVWPVGGNCVKYTNCLADAPVVRCAHDDGIDERGVYYPHTWPDFAWEYIWDFFSSQGV